MKPNILILHADQHRADCIGAYGNHDIRTPHIDSLATDGTLYDAHYTVYPVCTPARYSFISGQYVHQHCAWSNESTLPAGIPTFPAVLRENGYHTAAVGKMHFTPTYQDVGYETMMLAEQNGIGRFEDDYHKWLMQENKIDRIDLMDQTDAVRQLAQKNYYDHFGACTSDLDASHHSTAWIGATARAEIENWNRDGGNLLFVGFIKPHHPFDPPVPYDTMYNPASLTLLDGYTPEVPAHDMAHSPDFFDNQSLDETTLRRIMAHYYGTITQIDDEIGCILSLLKLQNIYDNTLIIYTSDHGEYMGYHHMLLKGNFMYEPLARIPLIIKYPKNSVHNAPAVCHHLCETVDIASTILHACQLAVPDTMHGIDLANFQIGREFAFSEGQYGSDKNPIQGYMVRSRRYKLLLRGSFENAMFFDLQTDPTEKHNRFHDAALQSEIAAHVRFLVQKMLFQDVSRNHCDLQAPQLKNPQQLAHDRTELQLFVQRKVAAE
ncbi:MAG: sulfatase-like hydrolase/transferase [Ruthenibacterium sp.]